jgi:hypothetical protein
MLWREQVNHQWDDDEVRFVLDQNDELDFNSASSLKQQSAGRNVTPFRHIISGKPYKNPNFDKEDILVNHKSFMSSLNIPINEENCLLYIGYQRCLPIWNKACL